MTGITRKIDELAKRAIAIGITELVRGARGTAVSFTIPKLIKTAAGVEEDIATLRKTPISMTIVKHYLNILIRNNVITINVEVKLDGKRRVHKYFMYRDNMVWRLAKENSTKAIEYMMNAMGDSNA